MQDAILGLIHQIGQHHSRGISSVGHEYDLLQSHSKEVGDGGARFVEQRWVEEVGEGVGAGLGQQLIVVKVVLDVAGVSAVSAMVEGVVRGVEEEVGIPHRAAEGDGFKERGGGLGRGV